MAILVLNVKMTDPLVVAAELSERNYPGKCSGEVWGPSETHLSSVAISILRNHDFRVWICYTKSS